MAAIGTSALARTARLGLRATPDQEAVLDLLARQAPWEAP